MGGGGRRGGIVGGGGRVRGSTTLHISKHQILQYQMNPPQGAARVHVREELAVS